MKLTRLKLIGFKSFVEPTEFLIEPGLTGVVGPNADRRDICRPCIDRLTVSFCRAESAEAT